VSLPGRLVDVGGLRLFFHRTGKRGGIPVVLVHGLAMAHYGFRDIVPALASAGHDVIALDLPGHGESDRPSSRDYSYDGETLSRTLEAFLDALDVDRARLVGHSMGGAVSLLLAARSPGRVDRLVLIDPIVFPFPLPLEGRILLTPVVGLAMFRSLFTRGLLQRYLRRQIFRDTSRVTEEWVDYLWERLNRPGGMEATHACLRFLSEPSLVEQCLPRVRVRTRILWGEDDQLLPSAWARRLAGAIAGSDFQLVQRCGHSPAEERPDQVLEALLPFLSESPLVESASGAA
jgi:pimeloyl-ACP methyl ester carboxylesterase